MKALFLFILLGAVLLALWLTWGSASALDPSPMPTLACDTPDEAYKALAPYDETIEFSAAPESGVPVLVLANWKKRTYSVLIEVPGKALCLIAAGKGGRWLSRAQSSGE